MGRSAQSAGEMADMEVLTRRGAEIERMSPAGRKAYLRGQLDMVDTQIGAMLHRLTRKGRPPLHGMRWTGHVLDEGRWASLSSLGYLVAERDALEEAIGRL